MAVRVNLVVVLAAIMVASPTFGRISLSGRESGASQCIPVDNEDYSSCACSINNDSEKVINLAPLLANSSVVPRFTVTDKGNWKFSYNPCHGFDMFAGENNTKLGYKPCNNAAMGRWTKESTHQCFTLGSPDSAKFTLGPNQQPSNLIKSNLTVQFTSDIDKLTKNQGVISLVCNSNVTVNETKFEYLNVTYVADHTIYFFSLESKCCCPGECGTPPPAPPTKAPKPKGQVDQPLVIGLSVAAAVLVIILVIAVACLCCKKRGYTSV